MIKIFHYFGHILGRLPLFIQSWLGAFLGMIMFIVMTKRRSYVSHNLAKVYPDRDCNEIRKLNKGHFKHLGKLIIELLTLPALTNPSYRNRKLIFDGVEKIRETLKSGQPAMVLTAHMGNWEIMTTLAAIIDTPFSALYKEQNNIWDKIISHMRTCSGIIVIPNKKGLKGIIKALRNNELVGVLADQGGMEEYNFFSYKTRFPTGAATFHIKHKAVAFPVFGIRQDDGRTKVTVLDPVFLTEEEQSLNRETQIDTFMTKYIKILEDQVMRCPEQYYWVHDVWRDFKGARN
jgi:KDO2-lipid IV(A) lauroyltransferase